MRRRCLIIELWWIGDAVLMTTILQGLLRDGWEVTVLGKSQSERLLSSSYPEVRWILFDAPWTAFYEKYQLWRWPWHILARILSEIRRGHFDAAISIRHDPRDQFLLWLAGVPRRIGFRAPFGSYFLNEIIASPPQILHRTEEWWLAQKQVSPTAATLFPPRIVPDPALMERYRSILSRDSRPVLAIHCGARNPVRRWPASYFAELVSSLRTEFEFQLAVFLDTDGYGAELEKFADHIFSNLGLHELISAFACVKVLIANDSGPGHLADALNVHVVTIFGPGDPTIMRPYAARNLAVIRDICPYHPCSDYCRYSEPFCLTHLKPASVVEEIREYLYRKCLLPLSKPPPPANPIMKREQIK